MTALVLRTTYGSPLSILQMDSNLTAINGNSAGLTGITSVTTLLGGNGVSSSSNLGQIVQLNAAVACTMPMANTAANGSVIEFFCSVNGATVLSHGSDTFLAGTTSITTFNMDVGDSLKLVSNGIDAWGAVSGSVTFPYSTAANTLVNGLQNIPVGGNTDITLTALQTNAQIMEFTGVLTGNINVIVPASAKTFIALNNTTGAFTLTVKTPSGTGILVNQSKTQELVCDGVNIIIGCNDLLGANIASLGTNTYTGAQNGNATVTIPSASTVDIGAAASNDITISGTTSINSLGVIAAGAVRTIHAAGSFTINASSNILTPAAQNIVAVAGDTFEVVSQGGGVWKINYYTRGTNAVTPSSWGYTNTSITVTNGSLTNVDTTGVPVSITLPSSPVAGYKVSIGDYHGTFAINNLTVIYSGVGIMNLAQNMTVSINNVVFTLTYIDSTIGWKLT